MIQSLVHRHIDLDRPEDNWVTVKQLVRSRFDLKSVKYAMLTGVALSVHSPFAIDLFLAPVILPS